MGVCFFGWVVEVFVVLEIVEFVVFVVVVGCTLWVILLYVEEEMLW